MSRFGKEPTAPAGGAPLEIRVVEYLFNPRLSKEYYPPNKNASSYIGV
jgi:hypothetical protein